MPKILYVSTSTTLGGAEKTLYTLATLLDPKKHQVVGVVSLKPEGIYAERLSRKGVKVETLGLTSAPRPSDAKRLAALIRREKPDLVHAILYQAIQLCRMAKPLAGLPFKLVSSPRVNYRSRSWWTLLVDRWLKERDDLLIAECEASRRFLLKKLGYAPAKVVTIRNGIDLESLHASEENRRKKRLELGLDDSHILVGATGRLDKQKGFSTLVEAMAKLRGSPVRCVILGEGPERKSLEALIKKRRLEGDVRLLGEQKDASAWLSAFDLYCLPSLWEGLPNSLLEAMGLGLPVVASAVDGVPEAVLDGSDGMLVPPEKPLALAAVLRKLLDDPARRAALGKAARETVEKRFGLRRMIDEYQTAYASLELQTPGVLKRS